MYNVYNVQLEYLKTIFDMIENPYIKRYKNVFSSKHKIYIEIWFCVMINEV